MQKPETIGKFALVSGEVVVTDPGYDMETASLPGLGAIYGGCANGSWTVRTTSKPYDARASFQVPDVLIASHESAKSEFDDPTLHWETLSEAIGGDHAMIGIYDRGHFHDDQIIPPNYQWKFGGTAAPADPGDLWYSYNCEVIPPGFGAAVLPHGCVLHWDGAVRASVARDKQNRIVLFRLKTNG